MVDHSRTQTRGFLFADLRGYTAFTDQRGDVAASALLDRYRALVRAEVARFDGAEIRTEGDGFYIVFPSASSAVRCGLAIVAEAARATAEKMDEPLRVAVGIHAGETAESDEGYVGAAVNIAARVCGVAREGEVLVTETVRSLTRTLLPGQFVSRGSPRLKGVAESIPLYRVEASAADAVAATGRGSRPVSRMAAALALAGVCVAVLLLAIVAANLGSGQPGGSNGTGTPAGSALASATATAAAGTPQSTQAVPSDPPLSFEESELFERVPAGVRDMCVPDYSGAVGSNALLRCPLALGADADTAWYELYDTAQLLDLAMGEIQARESLPEGACSEGFPAAGEWSTPAGTYSGRLLCFSGADGSWIVWSYETELIVASATRNDQNGDALFEWWKTVGPFLR